MIKSAKQLEKTFSKTTESKNNNLVPVIIHDLRTPINSIISFSSLVKELFQQNDFDKEEIINYLNFIIKQAENVNQQILSLSEWNFSFEKNISHKQRTNIKKLILQQIEINKEIAKEKGITFTTRFQCIGDEVISNKKAIDIVLRNLISNAIKFSKNNGTIEIAAEGENKKIVISVKDYGIGLSKNNTERIFKSRLLPEQGTANEIGLGIGLKLCKQIIESLGEKIWVDSSENNWTKFYFTIPREY
ncbi:MAG: HAMP domain-containing histidine kinase [Chlorobi bacterium]|nr:HAMP domain-containing histidine kinase [Chlorobiota bacterium]